VTIGLNEISLGLGALGFACFVWPIYQRLSGKAAAEPLGSGKSLRSPLWWAGFVLTVAAIFLQRIAAQQMAGG
jgi:hypothetical protein